MPPSQGHPAAKLLSVSLVSCHLQSFSWEPHPSEGSPSLLSVSFPGIVTMQRMSSVGRVGNVALWLSAQVAPVGWWLSQQVAPVGWWLAPFETALNHGVSWGRGWSCQASFCWMTLLFLAAPLAASQTVSLPSILLMSQFVEIRKPHAFLSMNDSIVGLHPPVGPYECLHARWCRHGMCWAANQSLQCGAWPPPCHLVGGGDLGCWTHSLFGLSAGLSTSFSQLHSLDQASLFL